MQENARQRVEIPIALRGDESPEAVFLAIWTIDVYIAKHDTSSPNNFWED